MVDGVTTWQSLAHEMHLKLQGNHQHTVRPFSTGVTLGTDRSEEVRIRVALEEERDTAGIGLGRGFPPVASLRA